MTTQTVTLQDFQSRLTELLKLVQTGNEIVITEGQKPLARLVPMPRSKNASRVAGLHRGKIRMSDDFDAPLPDEFRMGS